MDDSLAEMMAARARKETARARREEHAADAEATGAKRQQVQEEFELKRQRELHEVELAAA